MTNLTENGNENLPEMIRAVKDEIDLKRCLLDVYTLPDGEERVDETSFSLALGYTERWLYNRTRRQSKWLKEAQEEGFTGRTKEVFVLNSRMPGGGYYTRTLSIEDFTKIVTVEALRGNRIAVTFLAAFAEIGFKEYVRQHKVKRVEIDFQEVYDRYSQWSYEEYQEVLEYNREEARALNPWRY